MRRAAKEAEETAARLKAEIAKAEAGPAAARASKGGDVDVLELLGYERTYLPTKKNHAPKTKAPLRIAVPPEAKGLPREELEAAAAKERRDLAMTKKTLEGYRKDKRKSNRDVIKFWEMRLLDCGDRVE